MTGNQHTLNSRLRVLIAKTFKAEKLYSSLVKTHPSAKLGVVALSHLANDIRSKEWQKMHEDLRLGLNSLLRLGQTSTIANELEVVWTGFVEKLEESLADLQQGERALREACDRGEYSTALKISAELVRHKARSQSCKVIIDELKSLLESSGRVVSDCKQEQGLRLTQRMATNGVDSGKSRACASTQIKQTSGSKIVPFAPRPIKRESDKPSSG